MSVWVVDASPLIFLAKLDRLDLLIKGASQILVPPTVLNEVQAHSDAASSKIEEALPFFDVRMPASLSSVKILKANLDAGEAEVIALGMESNAERFVMDDLEARRFARRVGLPLIGTLGLLLASESLVQAILKAGGELE